MSEKELTNQEKLDEMYHLMQETHEIIRAMRRRENVAMAFKLFYWVVILASLGGIYLFVSPLVNSISNKVDSAESSTSSLDSLQGGGFGAFVNAVKSNFSQGDGNTSAGTSTTGQ